MRSPLRYQVTPYDCGPTTMINAIMFLFEREEIPPDVVRHIGQCTLDSYDTTGHCGRYGTSGAAVRYFGSWLNELRFAGLLPIRSSYLEKEEVHFEEGSRILRHLKEGGACVLHVFVETGHYILLTGLSEEGLLAFDPYYRGEQLYSKKVRRIEGHPFSHNLLIPWETIRDEKSSEYSVGAVETREAILIGREAVETLYVI